MALALSPCVQVRLVPMRSPPRTTISMGKMTLEDGNALILVGLQRDAFPGGTIAIADAPAIIPIANRYLSAWANLGLPIVLGRCWHPPNHCSFRTHGGPWPDHAIADTPGAAFAADLLVPPTSIIVSTGTDAADEASSAFADAELDSQLRRRGTTQVFVGGIATEHCVLNTVRDAIDRDYATVVLRDASRATNVRPDDGADAEGVMAELGAQLLALETLGL